MTDTGSVRRFQRRQLAAEIFLKDSHSDAELIFDSADISPAGVFVRSDLLLDLGDEFEVRFTLPGDEAPMRVRGRVVRAERGRTDDDAPGPGMGVEFLDLSDDDTRRILDYTGSKADSEAKPS